MKTATRVLAVTCLALSATLLPGLAAADQIVMDNGDVINGNLKRIEDDTV